MFESWKKLFSAKGEYLGILLMPRFASDHLARDRQFVSARWKPVASYVPFQLVPEDVTFNQFCVCQAAFNDGVILIGITPREICFEPGFAFVPGPPPDPEPKVQYRPVEPGRYLEAARAVLSNDEPTG